MSYFCCTSVYESDLYSSGNCKFFFVLSPELHGAGDRLDSSSSSLELDDSLLDPDVDIDSPKSSSTCSSVDTSWIFITSTALAVFLRPGPVCHSRYLVLRGH